MRRTCLALFVAAAPSVAAAGAAAAADPSVGVPWPEFKALYRESVERAVRASLPPVEERPGLAALDLVAWRVGPVGPVARARARVEGRLLEGTPRPVPLFPPGTVVAAVAEARGGALVSADGVSFLPLGLGAFAVEADLLLPSREEGATRTVAIPSPSALRTTLAVDLAKGQRLLEAPGLPGDDGVRHCAGGGPLMVRVASTSAPDGPALAPTTAPVAVLDALRLFVSIAETGGTLSTLRLAVPVDAGARLALTAVPGAELWSCTVNAAPARVLTDAGGRWVVPLAVGRPSLVELCFRTASERLGLRGRLEVVVPATGLPAREVQVTLGLPERVELSSVEGPVSAGVPGGDEEVPGTFVGQPRSFQRHFDPGSGFVLTVGYREPAVAPSTEHREGGAR